MTPLAKLDDVYGLAHQLVEKATTDRQSWESFLQSAAYTSSYAYPNQLLIWNQRPDATACASIQYWNRNVGRWVRRGSHGIAILDTKSGYNRLSYIFDITDTTEQVLKPDAMPWMVTDENRAAVWDALCAEDAASDLESLLMLRTDTMFGTLQQNLLADLDSRITGSNLEWFDHSEQQEMFRRLICQSVLYMSAVRLGMDTSLIDTTSFDAVQNFDSQATGICLGSSLRQVAKPILAGIGTTVRQTDSVARESRIVHNEAEAEKELHITKEADNGIHEHERVSDSQPDHRQAAEPGDRQVRQPAPGISQGERAGDLRRDDHERNLVSAPAGERPDGTGADQQHDGVPAEKESGTESEKRPAGLDAAHEQLTDGSRGTGIPDAVRPVNEKVNTPQKAESEETPSAFSVSEERYQEVTLFEVPALFSNGRVERSQLPPDLFCYDLRGSDDNPGNPICVGDRVVVNHAGSVITAIPIPVPESGHLWLGEELNFDGGISTLAQFQEAQRKMHRNVIKAKMLAAIRTAQDHPNSSTQPALPPVEKSLIPEILCKDGFSRLHNYKITAYFADHTELSDRAAFMKTAYQDVFTEVIIQDQRAGFHKEQDGLLIYEGKYLSRQAETKLSWQEVAQFISDYIDQGLLIEAIPAKTHSDQVQQLTLFAEQPARAPRGDMAAEIAQALGIPDTDTQMGEIAKHSTGYESIAEPIKDSDEKVITETEVSAALCTGSGFAGGKDRITAWFAEQHSDKESADWLKKEYGIGGCSWQLTTGERGWLNHDGKGFEIDCTADDGTRYKRALTWNEVAKRIELLIQMDRYLTPKEKEQRSPKEAENQIAEAIELIEQFCVAEYGDTEPEEYNDLHHVPIAFTTTEDDEHALEVEADLEEPAMRYMIDGETLREDRYTSLRELIDTELSALDYDGLIATAMWEAEQQGYLVIESPGSEKQDLSDLEFAKLHLHPDDTTFEWEGRMFMVDRVNEQSATMNLQDITFVQHAGFPIFRVEPISTVRKWIEHQPEEVQPDTPFVAQVMKDVQEASEPHSSAPINYTAPYYPDVPAGAKEKFSANLTAIRVLKQIEQRVAGGGSPANEQEQRVLAAYCGWGGLADAFDPSKSNWSAEYAELKGLLTDAEYEAARSSTLTAFYTPAEVIHPLYRALERMGVTSGNILDPAMGTGAFYAHKPSSFDLNGAKLYGVELDSITGRIAKQLYQKAMIQVTGYEKANLPDSFFDCVLGNVPFGDFSVSDRQYDKLHYRIHDYFLAKSVDKLRTGGIMAIITSSGTLDKKDSTVRKYLASRCELIGAVRLPNNTFRANAGTEVTSDVLFFQKRDRLVETDEPWLHLAENEDGITVNRYFVEHPEMICGKLEMVSGPYGPTMTCQPVPGEPLEQQLDNAMQHLKATLTRAEIEISEEDQAVNTIPADPSVRNFSYTLVDDTLYYRENSIMREVHPGKTAEQRIRQLIVLRDTTRELLQAQLDDRPDEDIAALQAALNQQYDAYQQKHGLINSRSGSMAFSDDSSYFLLCSLEDIDDDGNYRGKTDMFSKRTVRSAHPVDHVDTASDALALSIGEKARVDLKYMAELTGKTQEQLCDELSGVIFCDPDHKTYDGQDIYQPADEYLSGNVRQKLAIAKSAAETDPRYRINVQALEQVQPKDLDASEIAVRIGATWIPIEVYKQFMTDLMELPYYISRKIDLHYVPCTGVWNVSNKGQGKQFIKATAGYGTQRANFYKIFEESLNLRSIRVFDVVEDLDGNKKSVLNAHETQAAQEKQRLIEEAFADWIFKDQTRRQQLVKLYNTTYNSIRPREFDGSHIQFVGMNPEITLRPHQRNAIAHILYGGNTLLAHVVGSGKTYEMVAAAMEQKRLGLCSKTMITVPNHLTEQLASEALTLYPNAKILVATHKDFEKSRRKRFCSKIATGDYDIIVIGHSQFERIPLSPERQESYLREQINSLIAQAAQMKAERAENFTIKQIERMRKQLEKRLDKLVNFVQRDDVVCFEELGVDSLMVDEAHNFKNLACQTKMRNVAGINQTESQKASDMLMKCMYLDEITGGRGVTFATGTPISNSMTEMYTMMRYLQYHTLEQNGIAAFDSWASTFGQTVTAIELAPEGTGYRTKTRFSKFYNLPELMSLFKQCADVQTADMLQLPVPALKDGKPIDIALEPSQQQKDMVAELAERADEVRSGSVDPTEDNLLKITNDGRKLALDQRLIDPDLPDDPGSKVNVCAERVYEIWKSTSENRSTQLIFSDLSTPKPGIFNIYDDLRNKLIARGIPEEEIQFIHSAGTESQKADLFSKVRNGKVRILMGSTGKMGAGTNVQRKLIALHHLDVPWKPSDIEQREGRMVRQGNENPEVQIYRYVTKGTFDAYSWGIIENKQRFIGQIMTSKSPARTCDDMDEAALSYAEIKALAAGNPMIKEKMDLDVQVTRLKTLKAAYTSQHYRLEDALTIGFPAQQQKLRGLIANAEQDAALVKQNTHLDVDQKEIFSVELDGKSYDKREDAGRALLGLLGSAMNAESPVPVGHYKGFVLQISYYPIFKEFHAQLVGAGSYDTQLGADAVGNMTRLGNLLNGIEPKIPVYQDQLTSLSQQIETARAELEKPFSHDEELSEKSKRLAELDALLNMNEKDNVVDLEPEDTAPAAQSRSYSGREER